MKGAVPVKLTVKFWHPPSQTAGGPENETVGKGAEATVCVAEAVQPILFVTVRPYVPAEFTEIVDDWLPVDQL